jgi:DNA topoisomerase IA
MPRLGRATQARELYGAEYVPDSPRRYEKKVKNAQEAHEAIRPAGDQVPHAGAGRVSCAARSSRSTN